jgi:hypothetical protein
MIDLESKRIDLNMTPEIAFSYLSGALKNKADYDRLQAQRKDRANLSYPFIDVSNLQAVLAWMIFESEGRISRIERVSDQDREELGITNDMLLAAIEEAGGSLNRSGQYPIDSEIIGKLRRVHAVEV